MNICFIYYCYQGSEALLNYKCRECFEEMVGYVSSNNRVRDYNEKNNITNKMPSEHQALTKQLYKQHKREGNNLVRGFLEGFLFGQVQIYSFREVLNLFKSTYDGLL